jgi:hypothetical protein
MRIPLIFADLIGDDPFNPRHPWSVAVLSGDIE